MQFWQNIKFLTFIRFEQIYRDYFDLNTLLGLTIAGFAGYFFQANYVITLIGNQEMARTIALFACVGVAVFIKNLSHRIDDNRVWGEWINKYVKISLGVVIAIVLFICDAYTSNTAIENIGLEKAANAIESRIDSNQSNDLRMSKKLCMDEYSKYEQRENDEGVSYKTTKGKIRREIAKYDSLIAAVSLANHATVQDANKLRIATVSDGTKTKNVYFGSLLLLLAVGLELISTGVRHDRKSAESAIDRIPYSVSAITMATVYSKKTSVELKHTTTETKHEVPMTTVQAILQPKNGNEAVELYARGAIGDGDGWTIRKIARDFYGNENKRTYVNGLIQSKRELFDTLSNN